MPALTLAGGSAGPSYETDGLEIVEFIPAQSQQRQQQQQPPPQPPQPQQLAHEPPPQPHQHEQQHAAFASSAAASPSSSSANGFARARNTVLEVIPPPAPALGRRLASLSASAPSSSSARRLVPPAPPAAPLESTSDVDADVDSDSPFVPPPPAASRRQRRAAVLEPLPAPALQPPTVFGADAQRWGSPWRMRDGAKLVCGWLLDAATAAHAPDRQKRCDEELFNAESLVRHICVQHREPGPKPRCRVGTCQKSAGADEFEAHVAGHFAHLAFACPWRDCRSNANVDFKSLFKLEDHIRTYHLADAPLDERELRVLLYPRPRRAPLSDVSALVERLAGVRVSACQDSCVVKLAPPSARPEPRGESVKETLQHVAPQAAALVAGNVEPKEPGAPWQGLIAALVKLQPPARPLPLTPSSARQLDYVGPLLRVPVARRLLSSMRGRQLDCVDLDLGEKSFSMTTAELDEQQQQAELDKQQQQAQQQQQLLQQQQRRLIEQQQPPSRSDEQQPPSRSDEQQPPSRSHEQEPLSRSDEQQPSQPRPDEQQQPPQPPPQQQRRFIDEQQQQQQQQQQPPQPPPPQQRRFIDEQQQQQPPPPQQQQPLRQPAFTSINDDARRQPRGRSSSSSDSPRKRTRRLSFSSSDDEVTIVAQHLKPVRRPPRPSGTQEAPFFVGSSTGESSDEGKRLPERRLPHGSTRELLNKQKRKGEERRYRPNAAEVDPPA